jgi:hypothetical protein
MDKMQRLLDAKTSNLVTREDLATLFRILSTIFEGEPRLRQLLPPTVEPSPPTPPEKSPERR